MNEGRSGDLESQRRMLRIPPGPRISGGKTVRKHGYPLSPLYMGEKGASARNSVGGSQVGVFGNMVAVAKLRETQW